MSGDGSNDLVVRNAGDGTLSIYFSTESGSGPSSTLLPPFLPPITLTVGPGVSDMTLADVSGDGRLRDILVTYEATPGAEVGDLARNLGPGVLRPPCSTPPAAGCTQSRSSSGPASLTALEATAGVTAGALTSGRTCRDLVAIDPRSNTFSVLSGPGGGGRFANPVTLPTSSPAIAVLVAPTSKAMAFPDTIILSASGVTVYRGNGQEDFLPDPFTIAAGPEPTGMTVADLNGDGTPDLLVSNAYGDILVLLGNGDGTFEPQVTYGDGNGNGMSPLAVLPSGSLPRFHLRRRGPRPDCCRIRQRTVNNTVGRLQRSARPEHRRVGRLERRRHPRPDRSQ